MNLTDLMKQLEGMTIQDLRDVIANLGKLQDVIDSVGELSVDVKGLQPILDKGAEIVEEVVQIKDTIKEVVDTANLTIGQLDRINGIIDNAESFVDKVQALEESLKLDLDQESLNSYKEIVATASKTVTDVKDILANADRLDEIVTGATNVAIKHLDAYIDQKVDALVPELIAKGNAALDEAFDRVIADVRTELRAEADDFVDDTKKSLIPYLLIGTGALIAGAIGYHFLTVYQVVDKIKEVM